MSEASPSEPAFLAAIPVLRMFDVERTREFYLGFLGFALDWEHRFDPEAPLYMQVSRGALTLHLSEHHGDGSPGIVAFAPIEGIDAFHAEITARGYGHMRPGIEKQSWGRQMQVWDPSGNRIRFCERRAG
jgi:predicted enzyme related to lactoylglutathione lyase